MAIVSSSSIPAPVPVPSHRWATIRHAVPADAPGIGDVYRDVYRGTYAYTEFTDPAFVSKEIERDLAQWYVIEDATTAGAGTTIAGCISGHKNPAARRVYIRGMMIRPGWQGRGGTSALFGDVFHDFIGLVGGKVDVFHAETRTGDPRAQAVCEAVGLNPLAVLPGKDVFFGARETPVVMAACATSAWRARAGGQALIPAAVPVRDAVAALHRPMCRDIVRVVDAGPVLPASPRAVVDIARFPRPHGYEKLVFTCMATGEPVTLDYHQACASAEHVAPWCSSPATAAMLLSFARRYLEAKGARYAEGTCPASKPAFQQAFVDAGFAPLGYLPAWGKARDGSRHDAVLFGWTLGTTAGACLSPKATTIAVAAGVA